MRLMGVMDAATNATNGCWDHWGAGPAHQRGGALPRYTLTRRSRVDELEETFHWQRGVRDQGLMHMWNIT